MKDDATIALEKFIKLANDATSLEDAASLVSAATGDPNLHVFGELLCAPKVAALDGTKYQSSYDMLRLFAYHSFADYATNKSHYPTLSIAHERKLRRLSVASLANQTSSISYDSIRKCLHVESVRDVENAVLDAIYAGLLRARLDQRAQAVQVLSATGRDVPPRSGIPDMLALLSRWVDSSRETVASIDSVIGSVQGATANAARERSAVDSDVQAARLAILGTSADGDLAAGREISRRYPGSILRSRYDS